MPAVTTPRPTDKTPQQPAGEPSADGASPPPAQPSLEDHGQPGDDTAANAIAEPLRIRYRIRFAKTGLLRWISHRDLARLWERLLRRAELKLSMTEGFHPKPRIAFPSALALGVEGLDEVVEIELAQPLEPRDLLRRLRSDHQPGLTINSVCRLPDKFGKAQLVRSDYAITPPTTADAIRIQQAIDRLLQQPTVSFERKQKTLTVNLAQHVQRLQLRDQVLQLSLAASRSASLRPTDVLALLGLGDWMEQGSLITRVRVVLDREPTSEDAQLAADPADDRPTSQSNQDSTNSCQ